jgi:hypothetical protein
MRYLIQQNIILFLAALVVYYYNPSFGLILLALSAGFFAWNFTRRKTRAAPLIALLCCASVFLLLEDYSTKRQAKMVVAEVFDYYRHHHQTPKNLGVIFFSETMKRTSRFTVFNYSMKTLSRHRCEWKLEFSNVWGTHYFYNDRSGEFEETEPLQGTNDHWNIFWKVEPHLQVTDTRFVQE